MAAEWKDPIIYDELWDQEPAVAVTKGLLQIIEDVFGFWLNAAAIGAETTFVYRCRQVEMDKITGTGEAINAGDRVYAMVAQNLFVTATPAGVAGTDFYFCGWAKRAAAANATTVLVNFDGTWPDRAA